MAEPTAGLTTRHTAELRSPIWMSSHPPHA